MTFCVHNIIIYCIYKYAWVKKINTVFLGIRSIKYEFSPDIFIRICSGANYVLFNELSKRKWLRIIGKFFRKTNIVSYA